MDVVAIIVSILSLAVSAISYIWQRCRYHVNIACDTAYVFDPETEKPKILVVVENRSELAISIRKVTVTDPNGSSYTICLNPVKISGYDTAVIRFPGPKIPGLQYFGNAYYEFRFFASRGTKKQLTHKVILHPEKTKQKQPPLPQVIEQK